MAFQFGDDTFYLIMNEPVDLDENLETDEEESSFDSDEDEEDEDEIIERILLRRFQQNRFENINGYEKISDSSTIPLPYLLSISGLNSSIALVDLKELSVQKLEGIERRFVELVKGMTYKKQLDIAKKFIFESRITSQLDVAMAKLDEYKEAFCRSDLTGTEELKDYITLVRDKIVQTVSMTNIDGHREVTVGGEVVKEVASLVYLGSQLSLDGSQSGELQRRIRAGMFAFDNFRSLFINRTVPMTLKRKLPKLCSTCVSLCFRDVVFDQTPVA
ncbi:unnamed protein product [Caenorhabditis bovis]|uniref:Uncharacterized protein n=1 Tax=Caenorhabditis bovis TaxID=2654633 RepID=A0A8S1ELF7_9PELO|nr:unnamed protein product [Caenorhabditis bovis]